ncbi:hypothetical protein GJW-30_1_01960 [Variibacter gotjawalensis]|uniref:Uncharacterized protein n=1 Tax=Variibacter gotjawalensis TaxID=1333996 RepID=A0A0S3PU68_9BRAD|nr:hypothetical protein [Variibacter gotjawalensis]RZS45754.1 hypothetical protein EV661_4078 [Variibacter gotjawalensis]BAT59427.1 hypothetical protein GJW-30_1_01960 [Variibacter gotjawalensis]
MKAAREAAWDAAATIPYLDVQEWRLAACGQLVARSAATWTVQDSQIVARPDFDWTAFSTEVFSWPSAEW